MDYTERVLMRAWKRLLVAVPILWALTIPPVPFIWIPALVLAIPSSAALMLLTGEAMGVGLDRLDARGERKAAAESAAEQERRDVIEAALRSESDPAVIRSLKEQL